MDILIETPVAIAQLPNLYEVVNGEIKERHAGAIQVAIAFRLACLLENFAMPKKLGQAITEMLFYLRDEAPQRQPDAAFISSERWPLDRELPTSKAWPVVPDLTVEVVSPSNTYDEIRRKIHEYFQAGVRVVWIVSTLRQEVEVFRSLRDYELVTIGDVLKGDPVLPGFELPLAELFSRRTQ